ncbi:MAG: TetR family transcriptional regulator [Solirubrobacterales bacterium]|nr:TetR family transcriptional regulator [Solirubrobacterales bacterium]
MADFAQMADTPQPAPRRQQRGRERRDAIIQATVSILREEGLEGVTHRRVADAAGVPLAATTYYFSSKEQLMEAAMSRLIQREAELLDEIARGVAEGGSLTAEEGIDALVQHLRAGMQERRLVAFAEFELYLRMARTTPGSPELHDWPQAFLKVAETALAALGAAEPRRDAHTLVALIHGLAIHGLTAADPERFADEVTVPVIRAWCRQVLPAAG